MSEHDLEKLAALGREELFRVLDDIDRRRRIVVALLRALPRKATAAKRKASAAAQTDKK